MREGVKWWVKEGVKEGVNLTLDQVCVCEGDRQGSLITPREAFPYLIFKKSYIEVFFWFVIHYDMQLMQHNYIAIIGWRSIYQCTYTENHVYMSVVK